MSYPRECKSKFKYFNHLPKYCFKIQILPEKNTLSSYKIQPLSVLPILIILQNTFVDVLLTVRLSIIFVINQLNAQNLFL